MGEKKEKVEVSSIKLDQSPKDQWQKTNFLVIYLWTNIVSRHTLTSICQTFDISEQQSFLIWFHLASVSKKKAELETKEFQSLRNAVWRRYLMLLHRVTQTLKFYSSELRTELERGGIFGP